MYGGSETDNNYPRVKERLLSKSEWGKGKLERHRGGLQTNDIDFVSVYDSSKTEATALKCTRDLSADKNHCKSALGFVRVRVRQRGRARTNVPLSQRLEVTLPSVLRKRWSLVL